jgi:phosphate-selective porin
MPFWGVAAAAILSIQASDQNDRLKKLEERVEAQQKEIEALKKARPADSNFTGSLTDEEKQPETRITPVHPFDLAGGWGAIELALRVADARVSNRLGDFGILLAGNSLEVMACSGGVNWWLTRNVRFSADVIREDYHGKINFGAAGGLHGALTGFLARFQIDF